MVLGPSRAEPLELQSEELEALPVFPLPRVVLLPGGVLPLHIFEPRYRAMMRYCGGDGPRVIAMAMLESGWERDYEGRPAIRPVAGVGRIVAHRENADGTFDVMLRGVARVQLVERAEPRHPFRVARGELLVEEAEREPTLRAGLEALMATSASLAATEGGARSSQPPIDLRGSTASAVDRLADRWIADSGTRQAILEARRVSTRIALVRDAMVARLARTATPGASGGTIPPPN